MMRMHLLAGDHRTMSDTVQNGVKKKSFLQSNTRRAPLSGGLSLISSAGHPETCGQKRPIIIADRIQLNCSTEFQSQRPCRDGEIFYCCGFSAVNCPRNTRVLGARHEIPRSSNTLLLRHFLSRTFSKFIKFAIIHNF